MPPPNTGHEFRYAIDRRAVSLTVDDGRLVDDVRVGVFPAYGDPSREVTARVHVRSLATGWCVVYADGTQHHSAEPDEILVHAEYAVAAALLATQHDRVQLHASGTAANGKAVVAVGPSGAGKSSLAMAWAACGGSVLGDDIVFLVRDTSRVIAHPFKRLCKVSTVVARELGVEPEQTPCWRAGSEHVWYDPTAGAGWARAAPVGLIVFPEYRRGATTALERVSAVDALNGVLSGVVDTGLSRAAAFETLAGLAESAPAYRLVMGTAGDAVRVLEEVAASV